MHPEHIEHHLVELERKQVIVVIPSHGTVSHSYIGLLSHETDGHVIQFHLASPVVAVIFYIKDVVKIEEPTATCDSFIIRLRGPHQYPEVYEGCVDRL